MSKSRIMWTCTDFRKSWVPTSDVLLFCNSSWRRLWKVQNYEMITGCTCQDQNTELVQMLPTIVQSLDSMHQIAMDVLWLTVQDCLEIWRISILYCCCFLCTQARSSIAFGSLWTVTNSVIIKQRHKITPTLSDIIIEKTARSYDFRTTIITEHKVKSITLVWACTENGRK